MTDQDLDSGHLSDTGLSGKVECGPTNSAPNDGTVECPTQTNTRRWPRYIVDIPVLVRVTTNGPTKPSSREGHGINLNCGGMAIVVDMELEIGEQVMVAFKLPSSEQRLTFRCFIRDRVDKRYGVEFITEKDDDYRNVGELEEWLTGTRRPNPPRS